MAIPSGWRGERGRRGSPMSGSASEDEGPPLPHRSALDPRNGGDQRRPYSPVAETLFRKDLISAMKLPDNEPLEAEDYWTVTDTWKQEWERGVQVPVKPDGLPESHVSSSSVFSKSDRFTLPKKLICMNTSGSYKAETHQVTPMVLRAEQVCTYDLDNVDQHWLSAMNGERARTGQSNLTETEMERSIEELERQCWEKINSTLRNSDDMETAQDDSIICDVCRSPDSEESNEMVFCDQCNICVHQACYGITTIPSGSWLCRTCILGIKPPCELCPNKGGAMKSTRTGSKWAHVSCALWIPEVSIGCVEKMEPITKISSIPQSRWSLLCVLCKERMGSCIQCSVKTCKTAYHVTCAFKHNLEMRAIIEDESAEDGVKLRSYCQKHSLNSKKKAMDDSDSESGLGSRKSTMTAEEKSQARRQKMAKVEKEFYKLVDVAVAAKKVQLSEELLEIVYKYWVLKRVAGGNKPLLPPKGEDEVLNALRGEDTERDKMKKLVSIRQDLERVRNLAYMVSRREKISRSFVKLREQILERQLALLADEEPQNQMSLAEMSAVIEANHGPSVYDKMLANPDCEQYEHDDFEVIISRIAGEIKDGSSQIRKDNPRLDFRKKSLDTPQKEKLYERIFSDTSQSESEDDFLHNVKSSKSKKSKKKSLDGKDSKPSLSRAVVRSDSSMSSSEEAAALKKLSPTKNVSSNKQIYSDSDSDKSETEKPKRGRPKKSKLKDVKTQNKTESSSEVRADSDSTQHSVDRPKEFKTKAAMKEFTAADMEAAKKIMEEKKAYAAKNKTKPAYVSSDEDSVMEVDADVNNDFLLVPQRKAASKAQKKITKVEDKKQKPSKASGLFGSSDDESSAKKTEDLKKSPRSSKKKQTSTDSESEPEQTTKSQIKSKKHMSPRRKDKSKQSESVKVSPKDKNKKAVMDFTDSEEEPTMSRKTKESPRKSSKKSKPSAVDSILLGLTDDSEEEYRSKKSKKKAKPESSEDEAMLAAKQASALEYEQQQSGNFDTLFNTSKSKKSQSDSDSDSESGKKKLFDDFENPVVPLFVPQRRAAKKASAQLSEQKLWKKSQQEAYIKELKEIKAKKAAEMDNRSRKESKKSKKGSESEIAQKPRTRSSDSQSSSDSSSSDNSDSDRRGKSPRGRGRSPKTKSKVAKGNQKKTASKGAGRGKKSPRNKKDLDGEIKSSPALEYLMKRESQITNMLKSLNEDDPKTDGDGWIRTEESVKPDQVAPDKKLKTSEGPQPQGFHSSPNSPKGSSDSNSNSDSDDSVIRSIKARKKKESEKQQALIESKKKDDDITIHPPATPSSPEKRESRDNSFSDSNAKRSRRSDSERGASSDAPHQESSSRRLSGRAGDSGDGGLETHQRPGRPSRDGGSSSRERAPHITPGRAATSQSQQLKPSPSRGLSPGSKKSIFSPERSPRPPPDQSRSERGDERETGPGTWRSPRERKQAEQLTPKEKVLPTPTKSPSKSPALSRSFGEGSRSSPLQTHRSPAFGRSPARHSQHPLNKSLDSLKGDHTDPKLTITPNKSDNEPEEERPSIDSRKFSVESKDSDGDSAKSSLPEATVNGMADFSKEDSTDTLDFGDKPSDLRDSNGKEQAPAYKTDEGYVSAEKVQTVTPVPNSDINPQDASSKLRDMPGFMPGFVPVSSDKLSTKEGEKMLKPNNRLSTDDSLSSQEVGVPKSTSQTNAWSELERLSQTQSQQHMLDERYNQMQQQQQRGLTEEQKVVEAMQQQQQAAQYEAILNQMFNMQRKAGHEITQQQMAYAQQYMKDMGYGAKGVGHNQSLDILSQQINYQNQYNQMSYQHYLQQMQMQMGLNKKVQDQTDLQFLSAVQWQQQQEAWQAYQRMGDLEKMTQGGLREMQNLLTQGKGKFSQEQHAQFQKLQAEKRLQEERKQKQEEEEKRRKEEEKKRHEEKKRLEEEKKKLEEEKRLEEKRRQEEEKRKLEEERRRQEEMHMMEQYRLQEEKRIQEEQRRHQEEQTRIQEEEKKRKEAEEQQRLNFERYNAQQETQQRGYDYLKQHQDFLSDGHRRSGQDQYGHRDLVGQVQDQLGALTGQNQALFGLSKDQNSNKGVNNNKNELNHRVRPTSPRTTSCKVEENKREQELLQKQFPQLAFNAIPSATPVDTLPGFKPSIPSRENKRQSHEFHLETTVDLKARQAPQSVAGSDKDSHNSEPSGIPSCLLDSILETAKLPVWKPPDKTPDQQISSPAKLPAPSPPKPAPVTSERDSSFDDLVRHIDASPSQKPHSSKSSKRDHNSASEAERSDYDNDNQTLGMVDYDDPYGSSDDMPLKQRQVGNKSVNKSEEKLPEPVLTKRGTKVPCYAEKDDDPFIAKKNSLEDPQVALAKLKNQPKAAPGRGRAKGRPGRGGVFGRRAGPKYDQKAFEKVHKNLAGTDFDFEGEFDDDFGASPKTTELPASLKGFREQIKKAPIYMTEGKKDDNFDFDEEPNNDQIPSVLSDEDEPAVEEVPKNKPKGRAKLRRGRQPEERETVETPEPVVEEEQKISPTKPPIPKVSMSSRVSLPKLSIPKEDMPSRLGRSGRKETQEKSPVVEEEPKIFEEKPKEALPKIPTLKIKIGRTDSPVSVGSDETEFKSKKHRRGSLERAKAKEDRKNSVDNEEEGALQKVPKLKIKLGAPPPSKSPEIEPMETAFPPMAELTKEEVPPLILRTTPTSSPRAAKGKVTPRPIEPIVGERLSTSEAALDSVAVLKTKESPKSSGPLPAPTSSPKKKSLGSIDSLATKLLAKHQSSSLNDKTNELNNIFGPEEPLQVNMGQEVVNHQVEKSEEGPSELELLAMELSQQLAKEKQMKQQKDEEERKEKETDPGLDDEELVAIRHHDPKYKFKQLNKPSHSENRSSTSPGPPTPVKINLTTSSVVGDSNPLRRMRKKELLNQYYGIETVVPVSEAGTNGPSIAVLPEIAPEPVVYRAPVKMNIMREPPIRNIIKMPKAVASVTSVPTRADYQSQLEANMERKRKREGKPELPGKGKKGGKKKEEKEYKPKIRMPEDGEDEGGVRKTRGKPPKKRVVEESDEDDDPKVSFIESKKNESLKFAEELLANFDQEGEAEGEGEDKPERGRDGERRRKEKKQKRRRDEEDSGSQPNTKTPRIVIKFSKNKDPPKPNNIPKDNNGLTKPPVQKSGDTDMQKKLPKLKIKNLIEPQS